MMCQIVPEVCYDVAEVEGGERGAGVVTRIKAG